MAYDKFAAVDSSTLLFPPTVRANLAGTSPNYIINGAFEVNQRGLTSSTNNFVFGFDRWLHYYTSGTTTFSKQSFTPNELTGQFVEPTNYIRVVTTGQTGTGAEADISQRIEDVRTLAGQTATISFYAKASTGTPSVAVSLTQSFGTGGSPSSAVYTAVGKTAITTSWARYTFTVAVPSISGKTIGSNNDSFLGLVLWTSAGSDFNARTNSLGLQNVTIDFWGVQVEAGAVATPFRRNANSIQGELAACQRYYWRLTGVTTGYYEISTSATSRGGTSVDLNIANPVPLRIPATSYDFGGAIYCEPYYGSGASKQVSSMSIDTRSNPQFTGVILTMASSGFAAGAREMVYFGNNTTNYLGFSAEL